MVFYLVFIFSPNALSGIFFQQRIYQIFTLIRNLRLGIVEEKLTVDYILEHLLVVSIVEGRRTVDHLINQNTEGPPVSHKCLTLARYYLWTYIFLKLLT